MDVILFSKSEYTRAVYVNLPVDRVVYFHLIMHCNLHCFVSHFLYYWHEIKSAGTHKSSNVDRIKHVIS